MNEDARIIVVQESDYTTEVTSDESAGDYEIDVTAGNKLVIARKANGHSLSYGNVAAVDIAPTPVWTSRFTSGVDLQEFTAFGSYHLGGQWVNPVPSKAYPGWEVTALTAPQYILQPIGGWEVGFRPTKMRITWEVTDGDGTMDELGIKDAGFGQQFQVNDSSSLTEHSLSLTQDIGGIEFLIGSQYEVADFHVTNIEFYGIPV